MMQKTNKPVVSVSISGRIDKTSPLHGQEEVTSLQIAEATKKRHDHVLRDIRKMEKTWVLIGNPKFGETYYIDKWKRKKLVYTLNEWECLYISTKYNDEARAKLVLLIKAIKEAHDKQKEGKLIEAKIDKTRHELYSIGAHLTNKRRKLRRLKTAKDAVLTIQLTLSI